MRVQQGNSIAIRCLILAALLAEPAAAGPSGEIFSDGFESGDLSAWTTGGAGSPPSGVVATLRTFDTTDIPCSDTVSRLDAVTGNADGFTLTAGSNAIVANDGSWFFVVLVGDCSPMTNPPMRAYAVVAVDADGEVIRDYWRVESLP